VTVVAAVVICFCGLTLMSVNLAHQAQWWISHTQSVIGESRILLALMVDAETGERGYIVTGDEIYLRPWLDAEGDLPRHLRILRNLTLDNPTQQVRIGEIETLIKDKTARILKSVEARRQGRTILVVDKAVMDQFRLALQDFEGEEARLYQGRVEALDRNLNAIASAGSAIALLTILAAWWTIRRAIQQGEEAARLELLNQIQAAIEEAPASIALFDQTMHYVAVSRRFAQDVGVEWNDLVGRSHYEVFPELSERWRDIHRRCLAGASEQCDEDPSPRDDGETDWVSWAIHPWRLADGEIGGITLCSEIITARKRVEEALLEKTSLLAESNAELEQFAYVASHDLRQPLRMISSYLSLIDKQLKGHLSEEQEQFIGFAVDGAKRMDSLILGLLEYSRVGRAGEPVPVPLNEVIQEAVNNLSVAIKDADADVTIAPGFPTVYGDRMEMMRLFQNLLGNAVKYHASDCLPHIEVTWADGGAEWIVSVKDNGIGIAENDRQRAFKIFQRLVARDRYEGTGIGLAVCKKIVEKAGGRIWIESEIGVGSTFMFNLPKADALHGNASVSFGPLASDPPLPPRLAPGRA
jgi:PAS domain S-box-containing protein